jgi:aminoglycoside 3-N-acetyltransferase
MVHTCMSAVGWIPGGADTLVAALLDAVGANHPGGTLLALCSWEHHCYDIDCWPVDRRAAYLSEPPRSTCRSPRPIRPVWLPLTI